MRHRILAALATAMILLSACGSEPGIDESSNTGDTPAETEEEIHTASNSEPDSYEKETNESPSDNMGESGPESGSNITGVEISFDFSRMPTKASNQIAVWVEDEGGNIIKTIYVSDFAEARRGYQKREDAIPHWVAAANPDALSDEQIDAVSSATIQTGNQSFVLDLTDNEGNAVPSGRYTVKLEGTLFWSSNVLFSGIVNKGNDTPGEIEVREERSEPDNTDNEEMLRNVKMTAKGG